MAVELATAYVSIVPSTRGIAKQLQGEFDGPMEAEAKSSGGRFGAAFGTVAKRTMQATGVAVGAIFAKSLVSGFGRLQAIDDARFKLKGLGHDAQGVETIMASALDSVRGTAFGLGEAATIAAGAVAAGIEPGDQLTRTLKLTGDAASIAGVSLGEMGAIFGKVAAGNRMMTQEMNQLTDRGIPILQWLQEEFGVTAEAAREMVSSGQVDFETFQRIIEKNIGGAALTAGESFRGSLANMGAALGRFGAALLSPAFEGAPSMFARITAAIDALTPAAERFSRAVADRISGAFDFVRAAVDRFRETFAAASAPIEKVAGGFAAVDDAATRAAGGLRTAWDAISPLAGGLSATDDAATRMSDGLDKARSAGDLLAGTVLKMAAGFGQFRGSMAPIIDQVRHFWDVFREGDGIIDGLRGVFESVMLWLETGGLAQVVELVATAKIRMLESGAKMFSGLVEAVIKVLPSVITAVADAIPAIVQAIVTGVPLLLDAALILFTGLIDAIVVILPEVTAALTAAIPRIVQAIVDAIPVLLDAGITFFVALVDAVLEALPVIIDALVAAIPPIVQALVDAIPLILKAGLTFFLALVDAIVKALPVIIDMLITVLPTIVQAIVDAVPLILDAGLVFFSALIDGLIEALPEIITALAAAIPDIVGALTNAIPQIVTAGIEFFLGLIEAIILAIPDVVAALVDALPDIIDALVGSVDLIVQGGIELFLGLVPAISKALPDIITALVDAIPEIVDAIVEAAPLILDAGVLMFLELVAALEKSGPEIWAAISELAVTVGNLFGELPGIILKKLENLPGQLWDAGTDMMGGFIKGIGSKMPGVEGKALEVAGAALDKVNTFFKNRSPSKVMQGVGENVIGGLIEGFAAMRGQAVLGMVRVAVAIKKGTGLTTKSLESVGSDAIRGLISGIAAMRNRALAAVRSLASAVTARLKAVLKVRSPSQVFADIGQDVVAGFAEGIDAYAKQGITAIERFANAAVAATEPVGDALNGMELSGRWTTPRQTPTAGWRPDDVDLPTPAAVTSGGVTIAGDVHVGSRDDLQELRFAVRKLAIANY